MNPRIAIFPGSFDPMTIGHLDVLRRALPLFDKIIVAVGINTEKQGFFPLPKRLEIINHAISDMENVEVCTYTSLTTDLCRQKDAHYILRGIRSMSDFEYENNIANINRTLAPDIETVILFADPKLTAVSSSMLRELMAFGKNIDQFLP